MEQRFEHLVVRVPGAITDESTQQALLEKVEKDGWELVAVRHHGYAPVFYFKRPYVLSEPEPPLSRHELDCPHMCHD